MVVEHFRQKAWPLNTKLRKMRRKRKRKEGGEEEKEREREKEREIRTTWDVDGVLGVVHAYGAHDKFLEPL